MDYTDKKVLILGLGNNQGGLGATKFFAKAGAEVRVTDIKKEDELTESLDELKDLDISYTLGKHKNEDIDWADLVIRNQAIKPDNQYLKYARDQGKRVEMDMGIFLEFVDPKQIIGVTGTKGKSTTASLIYEILKNCHSGKSMQPESDPGGAELPRMTEFHDVIFAGNIGKSVLDTIPHLTPETLLVLEISSFQLEAFDEHQISPHIAMITNIFPDHLNYYDSMESYIASKRLIAKHQKTEDYLLLWEHDQETNNPSFLRDFKAKIIHFGAGDLPSDFQPTLPGTHSKINMAAALVVSKILDIDQGQALEVMKNFKGVEFRLQLIKKWKGVKIYNDTTASGPTPAIQALKALPNSILIAGGVNKNLPYEGLAKVIDHNAKKVYFLEGTATDEIKKLMREKSKIVGEFNNLEEILKLIKKEVGEGDVILFSPGAASFNLFQNEFDRGRKFNQAVEKVFSS